MYAKEPREAKYQVLINKWESADLKDFNDSNAVFIKYSNDMDIYKNIEEYTLNKKTQDIDCILQYDCWYAK